jgi:hypothetical protein
MWEGALAEFLYSYFDWRMESKGSPVGRLIYWVGRAFLGAAGCVFFRAGAGVTKTGWDHSVNILVEPLGPMEKDIVDEVGHAIPLIPAQAGNRGKGLGPRFRGGQRLG